MSEIKMGDKVFVKKTERFGSVVTVDKVKKDNLHVRYDDDASYEYLSPDDVILVEPDRVYTEKSGNVISVYSKSTFEKVRADYRKEIKEALLSDFRKKAVDPKCCKKFSWSVKDTDGITAKLYKAAKNSGYHHEADYEEREEREDFDDDFRLHDEDDLIAISKNELYMLIEAVCRPETLEKTFGYYDDDECNDVDWDAVSVCGSLVAILLWTILSKKTV